MPWMWRCRRQVVLWITRLAWAISTTIRSRCSHIRRATSPRASSVSSGNASRRLSPITCRRIQSRCASSRESRLAARSQKRRGSAWITQMTSRTAA
jgi:hypothetical protein